MNFPADKERTMTTYPAEGERVTISVRTGYVMENYRPMECRTYGQLPSGKYGWGCKCGKCKGTRTDHSGTVERLIHWADNSVEMVVACDDGVTRRETLKPPSGDVC